MVSPKRSKNEDEDCNSENCSKKSCTRGEDPEWTQKALEHIRFGKIRKRDQMAKLRDVKERIEEAERMLEWLNELKDKILLNDPAAEILELVKELCKQNAGDRMGKMMVADKMSEALEDMHAMMTSP